MPGCVCDAFPGLLKGEESVQGLPRGAASAVNCDHLPSLQLAPSGPQIEPAQKQGAHLAAVWGHTVT